MKRGLIVFLFIFLISLASAAPTLTLQHEEIQSGETIIITIITVGEFTKEITLSDITFLEGRKEVFFESDITFYNNTYYLYIYTTREGNFTIKISDILYSEADELQSITIEQPITIKNNLIIDEETNETKTKILSIKPGFIRTTDEPKLKLINKGTSILNFTYLENETSLQPQESTEIEIQQEETFSNLKISTYKEFLIPIIRPAPEDIIIPKVEHDLKFDPDLLLLELLTEEKSSATITLFNFGDENITDIMFNSDISFLKIVEVEELEAREVYNLSLTFSPKNPRHIQGKINITYTQYEQEKNLSIPLSLFILPAGSTEEDFKISDETCEDKDGAVCALNETCEGNGTFTKGGDYCCLSTCVPIKTDGEGAGFGWLLGLIILSALGFGGYYLYKKQKKITPKKPSEQLKESSEKYSKRLSGKLQRT
ncbi:MAG: hypothetical protein U9Q73_00020 [Nanoarchaeota archaeon]|nr:hypothetical protein [Nanoarchaeota archaeon]